MSKKNIIFLIVLAVFGLAIVGYFRAVPGVENQTNNRPQIEIMPKTFNFNEIEYGSIAKHTFKIKNLGKATLEIKKIATSCACTSAEVEKEIIEPNEEVELRVEYNTGLMSGSHAKGEQERIIYVKSNDPINSQTEVTIHALVQ